MMRDQNLPFILLLLVCVSCEKEIAFDLSLDNADQIVVEGYIEAGRNAIPPYVILTNNIPISTEIKDYNSIFEHNAEIWVSNGVDSLKLEETCWNASNEPLLRKAYLFSNVNLNKIPKDVNFCVYTNLSKKLEIKSLETYKLRVKTQAGKILTAQTTIPHAVSFDSVSFSPPPGVNQNDTMMQIVAYINEPIGKDFYRYFSSINRSNYIAGRYSVFDDGFIDGIKTKIALLKSEPYGTKSTLSNYGLWQKGDTASIKLCTIDKAHYSFWSTIESNKTNNTNPFAVSVKIKHNIEGGLGIWGGYNATYLDFIVPKK